MNFAEELIQQWLIWETNIWGIMCHTNRRGTMLFIKRGELLKWQSFRVLLFFFFFWGKKKFCFSFILIAIGKRILQVSICVSQLPLNPGWPINLTKWPLAYCFVSQYYPFEFCKSYYFTYSASQLSKWDCSYRLLWKDSFSWQFS